MAQTKLYKIKACGCGSIWTCGPADLSQSHSCWPSVIPSLVSWSGSDCESLWTGVLSGADAAQAHLIRCSVPAGFLVSLWFDEGEEVWWNTEIRLFLSERNLIKKKTIHSTFCLSDNKMISFVFQLPTMSPSLFLPSDLRVVVLQEVWDVVHRAGVGEPPAPPAGRSGQQRPHQLQHQQRGGGLQSTERVW